MGRGTSTPAARALIALALALGAGAAAPRPAVAEEPSVGLVERLGERVPTDLVLRDEQGAPVRLGDLLDRPTVLTLVYFRCAGICSPLLNAIGDVVERTGLRPGRDFQILTVSFDDRDTPAVAAAKKRNYLAGLSKDFPPDAWRFLTGDAATTKALADAVGFRFRREGNDFLHPAVVTALAPGGKITRYLYGITFLPFDLKMAVIEASQGRAMPSIARFLQICYRFDPAGHRYYLDLTRLFGLSILVGVAIFGLGLVLRRGGHGAEGRR